MKIFLKKKIVFICYYLYAFVECMCYYAPVFSLTKTGGAYKPTSRGGKVDYTNEVD